MKSDILRPQCPATTRNKDKSTGAEMRGCHSPGPDAAPLTRPLRTLVVNPSGVLGGAESWLLQAIDATDRLAVEVILLADGPLRAELETRGVRVTVHQVGPRPADIARAAAWLAGELRRRDPDVAVANGVKAQAALAPATLITGVPGVWVKHDHSYDRKLAPWLAKAATRVIATAPEVAVAARRADVAVLEPPRPPDPLPREEARAELTRLGVPDTGKLRLLMLGRYVPYKGVDTAIRALSRPETAQWELIAIGGDEPRRPRERERLRSLADVLGVSDRVHLLPYVPNAASLLTAADTLAVLTRPDGPRSPGREGFGMSALEAMVAGVPVLGVADGGPIARRIDIDANGRRAGIAVPPDNHIAVSRALAELTNQVVRDELGDAGRERAVHHPGPGDVARRFAALLAEAALRPGAGLRGGPAVSVVSPVLNEAANIDRLVGPIVTQLGPDDEYLLVDSGSVDGTRERIEAWRARDPRVRLITAPAGCTIGTSRNLGIQAARNAVIACTDAGCDPGPNWLAGFRAAAAEDGAPELTIGVYRASIRAGRRFEAAMAAVSWPDPDELRRRTPLRRAYGKLFGRAFSPRRVDGRSVSFRREAWSTAGGFPEHLRTAEDEAFGRALLADGARSALTLDAAVTWHQRTSVRATFAQFRGYGRGGGSSRSGLLVGRDAIRLLAYVGASVAAVKGGTPGRLLAAVGAAAALSVPVSRVLRRRQSPLILPLLPVALVLKDAAKMLGTAEALLRVARPAPPSGLAAPAGPAASRGVRPHPGAHPAPHHSGPHPGPPHPVPPHTVAERVAADRAASEFVVTARTPR